MKVTLEDVCNDWRLLDDPAFEPPPGVRLISHEEFTSVPELPVEYVPPGRLSRCLRFLPRLAAFVYAWRLLRHCDSRSVLILNGGAGALYLFVGLLNRVPYLGCRKILLWEVHVEVGARWKKQIVRAALKGMRLCKVGSRAQARAHAEYLSLPEDLFVFIPYKANHSKGQHYEIPVGRFVFSGGNGKRDYACLIEAVRDTDIPVIISATDPEVRRGIERLPNVIVLAASEPAFAQLMAASEFVVVPIEDAGPKGGGGGTVYNAMWHGKPVIAADSHGATDYVVEGETGYVVPSGDIVALRERILELWKDPGKVARMGHAARRRADASFTHTMFIRRLLSLATLCANRENL